MEIENIWKNMKKHEGESFYTIRGKEYQYVMYKNFILINNLESRKITKKMIQEAIQIKNPSPSEIGLKGCRGPSYIYGIITDDRINTL